MEGWPSPVGTHLSSHLHNYLQVLDSHKEGGEIVSTSYLSPMLQVKQPGRTIHQFNAEDNNRDVNHCAKQNNLDLNDAPKMDKDDPSQKSTK